MGYEAKFAAVLHCPPIKITIEVDDPCVCISVVDESDEEYEEEEKWGGRFLLTGGMLPQFIAALSAAYEVCKLNMAVDDKDMAR